MKRLIYRVCLWIIGLWTAGCVAAIIVSALTLPIELKYTGMTPSAIDSAVSANLLLNLLAWAGMVVPVGIIALLARPDPPAARGEPTV